MNEEYSYKELEELLPEGIKRVNTIKNKIGQDAKWFFYSEFPINSFSTYYIIISTKGDFVFMHVINRHYLRSITDYNSDSDSESENEEYNIVRFLISKRKIEYDNINLSVENCRDLILTKKILIIII